jgi:HD-GYP domain-containing protein (c-di-GMP phosphodiesterase class II)
MSLPWALYDENGVLLLCKGYEIRSQPILEAYLERSLFISDGQADEAMEMAEAGIPNVHAFDLIRRVERILTRLLRRPQDGHLPLTIPRLCQLLQLACRIDQDAALAGILLASPASYAVRHAIDVAIVTELLMKAMAIPPGERASALAAALTMNIGMHRFHDKLHQQFGSLTAEQRNDIRTHPQAGHDLLVQAGVTDPIWLEAVQHHHERPDGSGYPEGVKQGRIGLASLIIGALDLYCAAISPRGYLPRLRPMAALREIYGARGQKFGVEITDYLIKVIGLYPPGMRVKLGNGEMAMVIRRGERAHCPRVMKLTPCGDRWELAHEMRDTALPECAIQEADFLEASELNFTWEHLWRHEGG